MYKEIMLMFIYQGRIRTDKHFSTTLFPIILAIADPLKIKNYIPLLIALIL
jgi:hypothetical protein